MLPQVDSQRHYLTEKHATVRFSFLDVVALELYDFNEQNVLSSLQIGPTKEGFLLQLGCCYGLCGKIEVRKLRLEVVPGIPEGSIYSRATPDS